MAFPRVHDIGVHDNRYIRVRGFTLINRGAYTRLALNSLCHISCFPSDILKRTELLESIVHVPVQPLVAALRKITLNTPIKYGYYETAEFKKYRYFGDAMELFRKHLQKDGAFIGANLDVAFAGSGQETAPGDPVQLNFRMLINGITKPIQSGPPVHIDLDGMFTE